MKKPFLGILSIFLTIAFVFPSITAYALDVTYALTSDEVTVTNNVGKADTIYITDVMAGDIVNVYNAASGGKIIAKATVGTNKTDLTITIAQIGTLAGKVYISDTSKGMSESSRTEIDYAAELVSDDPLTSNITVTNNTGKADTIYVSGLTPGDIIKIYNKQTGGSLLGSATVGSSTTDVTKSFTQLGVNSGSVYISVTSLGMHESGRVEADYSAENYSTAPSSSNITITNNSGKADTVDVSGLNPGDIVKIYNAGGSLLGSATVPSNTTEVIKSFTQLGTGGGTLNISVTSLGMHESAKTSMTFSAEGLSTPILSTNVTITNNTGKADTIYVDGLSAGDKVNVYKSEFGGTSIATGTVSASGSDLTISVSQLGTTTGDVWLSVTSSGMLENTNRTDVTYSAEGSSTLNASNILVTNNAGSADTVYAYNLTPGDVIKVYDALTGGNLLGTATVATGNTDVTVNIAQLGTSAGYIYVSVTSTSKLESIRSSKYYSSEGSSTTIDASNISVNNNVGIADTVNVDGLTAGDLIKVYDSTGTSLLGSATVAAGATDGTVSITQLGTSGGTISVSITSTNKLEGSKISATYSAEGQSTTIDVANIIVSNNSGKADTVYVSGLTAGDVLNVYDSASGGTLLGTATVASSSTSATVSIAQLGTAKGDVYVSVTGTNKIKSARTTAPYDAENTSTAFSNADVSNIVITNNAGTADTVQVDGLTDGDVINVYDAAKGGNLLGTATVAQYSSGVTITIPQLGSEGGTIYLSRTSTNKLESDTYGFTYNAESQSTQPLDTNVSITNNSGAADTVKVTGLSANDVINVYDLSQGGNLLGTATVASGGTDATISITQLGTTKGSVYVSVTSTNKSESLRTVVGYLAEPSSTAPSNIVVTNNAGIADTVTVPGLTATDVVNVYDSATGGTLLGTATVASYATSATVAINQLGTGSGNIYVSVTSTSKLESARTQVGFIAETKSDSPIASNVVVVNNAGIAGTVSVTGVNGGDIINVYSDSTGGTLLGTATVGAYDTDATISVSQLGSTGGSIYITATSTGKLESDRTPVTYTGKLVSSTPALANITVVNNATISGTVAVTGLQPNDVVNIYDSATNGTLLGTATVPSDSKTVTLTLTQLSSSGGTIYVAVKSSGKSESDRTSVLYNKELQSDAPDASDITVVNNSGTADTIDVTGLSSNDIVNVYRTNTSGTVLGTATVASGDSDATVNISQLGTGSGSVYVSVIRYGDTESTRTESDYVSESTAPIAGNISIVNNAVLADTVTVGSLTANDIVNVYDAASNGNLLGSAVVSAGSTSAVVTIPQLTTTSGSVYISVTNFGKGESNKTKATYLAEQSSTALYGGNISIVNNTVGTSDTIAVSNLTPSSLVKVYDASTGGNLIGIATASSNGTQVTITVPQLSLGAGSVYLSVTTPGQNESSRTEADYVAEPGQ